LRWQELDAELEKSAVVFQDRSVYLITGGLGALGTLFAEEILARTHGARVILSGRSRLEGEKQARFESRFAGGRVGYRQVDLESVHDVERLVAGLQEEYGQLNGIVHSAGMVADNFILKKSATEFLQVLGPKVAGTYHLDQATRDVKLDFFVLLSSLAG